MGWDSRAAALLGLACSAGIPAAYADVSFHGYGQTVVGTTFSNNGRSLPYQDYYKADPSFTPESNFGLQASANLGNSITAVTQVLALGQNDFRPDFHWAYLKYQFNETFALKAGRLQLPYYQFSDYFYVGEAYPWIVLPEAVYINQINNYDGLNLSVQHSIGDWYFLWQTIFGAVHNTAVIPATSYYSAFTVNVAENNIFGLSLDASYNDWLSLRAAAFGGKLSTTGIPFIDQIAADLYKDGYTEASRSFANSSDPVVYYTASAQITRNQWLVLAEMSALQNVNSASALGTSQSQYIAFGRHFGKWLPLLTVGHHNQWISTKAAQSLPNNPFGAIDSNASSPYYGKPYFFLIETQAQSPQARAKDYYYEFTLRYDLTSNVALKFDWTYYQSHYKTSDFTYAELANAVAPGTFSNPLDANRYSAAVTFSF
jgi:hypothetical protein